jgi:hypothetical protein
MYAGIASKAANLLKSTARFTPAVLASCSAAVPAAGSVAAATRHAAHAIDVAEVEILAHTVVTSLGCGPSTASHIVPSRGREQPLSVKSNIP